VRKPSDLAPTNEILTRAEAAQLLRISLGSIDQLIRERKLCASRIGRRIVIRRADVLRTLEACEIQ
jgi:excisionase family DNA binding protein